MESNAFLVVYQCADVFAVDNLLEVAYGIHIKDDDGQVVFLTHARGGEVHHLQAAAQHFVPADMMTTSPASMHSMARHLL